MRSVEICQHGYYGGTGTAEPKEFSNGVFHGFFQEGNNEDGIEAYALIELEDGLVKTWPTHKMKFLDKPELKAAAVLN